MSFLPFAQMWLQVCPGTEPFAAISAAGPLLGSRHHRGWVWGMPFDSSRLTGGSAGSSRLALEGGWRDKTLRYFSSLVSLLLAGPEGSPVGGSAVSSP